MMLNAPSPSPVADRHVPACGLVNDFTWDNAATIIAAVGAALIAAIVAIVGYSRQQRQGRRDQRAALYAEALRAVEDYLEAPYRIRRRDGSADTRLAITSHISDVKSRINFYAGWLRIHAPAHVSTTHEAYVHAAQEDAGPQMTVAWRSRSTKKDKDVPLGTPYDRRRADAARDAVLTAMRDDL
jgi:hypothetical protein